MNFFITYKNKITVIALLVFSLCISFLLVKFFPALPVISDSEDYHQIAQHLITDHTYITISSDKILYPPLYPIFTALIYALTSIGAFSSVYLIQYFLVGATAACIFLIMRKFTTLPYAATFIGSIAILLWPYLMLYSQLISSEILYTFLLSLFILLFLHVNKQSTLPLLIFTGITIGLTILTRPVALLLLPCMLIGLLIARRFPAQFALEKIPWKKYLIILTVAFITVIPWEIYVKSTYDRVIPVSSNLSYVFNKANNTFAYLPESESLPEKKNVLDIIKIKARNVYLFWDPGASGYHLDILKQQYPIAGFMVSIYKLIFFIILILALSGSIVLRKNKVVLLLILVVCYFWGLHTILFPFPRYTLPIMPYMIILALISFSHGINLIKTKRANRLTSQERSN